MGTVNTPELDRRDAWASLMLLPVLPERAKFMPPGADELALGHVFVRNAKEFGKNAKYKIPGGGRKSEDKTPLDTAVREALEETGITVDPARVALLGRRFGGRNVSHWKHLYRGFIFESDRDRMHGNHPGNEGEIPVFLSNAKLKEEIYFGGVLETHVEWLVQLKILSQSDIAA